MKKQTIIALAFFTSILSYAQKKELKDAEKAIKDKNYAEAKTALSQVDPMLSTLDEKSKNKYYYLKGVALFANGKGTNEDIDESLKSFNQVKGEYQAEIKETKQAMVNNILTKGNKAYENKNYSSASNQFERVYNMNKKDTIYLYYAAATAVSVPDYDRALKLYEKLRDIGYKGNETKYLAVSVANNQEETFPSKSLRDTSVKLKTHTNPTDKKEESKRPEIIKNIALIYVSNGDNEKAIAAMKEARAQSPEDINLILSEANVHYKMGNITEFKRLLEEAIQLDPNNPELQYNLGVISSESGDSVSAKKYYNKAIELDPKYINAYINMAALVLAGEKKLIEEMNGLGTSKADNKRYDELIEVRKEIYRDAIPYLEKALDIDSKNVSAATTLMNIYSVLGETAKYKEMKAKVEALESGN